MINNRALFVTLDDTLIFTKSGRKFPLHSKDWIINIDLISTLKKYYRKDYRVIVVDNQHSVAHGSVDITVFEEKVIEILKAVENLCNMPTNHISYVFWTGDRDDYYQLPNPGLVYEMALDYELSIPDSILIGSSEEDFKFSKECGINKYIDIDSIK